MPMKRKQETADSGGKRASYVKQASLSDLRAELAGAARGSKASIGRVLSILKSKGQLADDRLGGQHEDKHLQRAAKKHGNADTPYGPVIQRLKLTDDYMLEYVHPCAYICYLSMICESFSRFINGILDTAGARPLHIIVYGLSLIHI